MPIKIGVHLGPQGVTWSQWRDAHPPILVAGSGPRIVGLVAKYADIYYSWPPLDAVQQRFELLAEACKRIGHGRAGALCHRGAARVPSGRAESRYDAAG